MARWESGEYSPQPWLRPRIAKVFGVSLEALSELIDQTGEAGTTGRTTGGAPTQVAVSDLTDGALVAGDDEVPAAELAAVLLARVILAAFATVADVARADGVAGSLASLTSVSSATQTVPAEWEDRLYDQLNTAAAECDGGRRVVITNATTA